MLIASFNVENLFERAVALNQDTWEEGRVVLELYAALSKLLIQPAYTAQDKAEIVSLLGKLGMGKSDDGHGMVRLRQNRGDLLKRPGGAVQVVANGRADWIGWIELKTEPVNELAAHHTAMVINDLNPDILGVVEAEHRVALKNFCEVILPAVGSARFGHVMVVDGNDERGIDVGLATKTGFEIVAIRSHVDDDDGAGLVFSRDCPEYVVTTPGGNRLVVLVNHLKSKGYGTAGSSDKRRTRQAAQVAKIYKRLKNEGEANVVVLGDFNDTPARPPLAALLAGTDLKDISQLPNFDDGGRPGTYKNGTAGNKIDYVLLSPALQANVIRGGIFRKGVWGGVNGTLWPIYPTMKYPVQAASDHAAIWAELAVP